MPGPRRRDWRTASSRDSVEVGQLLQRDADTFIAVERRTQASDCAAAESGQSGESAARRWTASRIPAAGGMRPIGRISGRHRFHPNTTRPVTMSARSATLRKEGCSPNAGYAKAVAAMGMRLDVTTEVWRAVATATPQTPTRVYVA